MICLHRKDLISEFSIFYQYSRDQDGTISHRSCYFWWNTWAWGSSRAWCLRLSRYKVKIHALEDAQLLWKQKNQIVNLRVIWNSRFCRSLLKTVLLLFKLHPFILVKSCFFIYLSKKPDKIIMLTDIGKFFKKSKASQQSC